MLSNIRFIRPPKEVVSPETDPVGTVYIQANHYPSVYYIWIKFKNNLFGYTRVYDDGSAGQITTNFGVDVFTGTFKLRQLDFNDFNKPEEFMHIIEKTLIQLNIEAVRTVLKRRLILTVI